MNQYKHIPDLSEFPTFQKELFDYANRLKTDVFEQVVENILGRPATPKDAKDFSIRKKIGCDYELISYKGAVYGAIVLSQDMEDGKWTIAWNYNPNIKNF